MCARATLRCLTEGDALSGLESGRLTLLVVDDDHEDRDLICEYLEDHPWIDVVEHDQLTGLLEVVEQCGPDAMLLDLRLPDGGGDQTLEVARTLADRVPTIVLTGMSGPGVSAEVLASGAQDYLDKNELTPALLIRTIRHAVERHAGQRERVRLQASIQQRDQGMRLFAELSSEGVVGIQHVGGLAHVTFCTATAKAMLDAEAPDGPCDIPMLLGRFHPDDAERLEAAILRPGGHAGSESDAILARTHCDDPIQERQLEIRVIRIPAVADEGDEIMLTMRDVTHQRRREAALKSALEHEQQALRSSQQASQLRDTLITAVSHQLRTPLTVILGLAETMANRGDTLPVEFHRDAANRIVGKARSLHDRVEDLFLLSGAVGPSLDPQIEPLDHCVRDAVMDAGLGGWVVDLELRGGGEKVAGRAVRRILSRLLDNVVQHTPVGTQVLVRTRTHAGRASIVIADDGPGLPDAVMALESVQPLDVDHDESAPNPGLGLGIPVARLLAERLGGRLLVARGGAGGTRVELALPLESPATVPSTEPPVATSTNGDGSRSPNGTSRTFGSLNGLRAATAPTAERPPMFPREVTTS